MRTRQTTKPLTEVVKVRTDAETKQALEELAQANERTASAEGRIAIRDHLERQLQARPDVRAR